jgi:hypothetical protein
VRHPRVCQEMGRGGRGWFEEEGAPEEALHTVARAHTKGGRKAKKQGAREWE